MTNRIEEIKKRRAAITPGPWNWSDEFPLATVSSPTSEIANDVVYKDAEFISHAPDDIDFLLAEVEKLDRQGRVTAIAATQLAKEKDVTIANLQAEVERLRKALPMLNKDCGTTNHDTEEGGE